MSCQKRSRVFLRTLVNCSPLMAFDGSGGWGTRDNPAKGFRATRHHPSAVVNTLFRLAKCEFQV
jgi:hypothetical protein